MKIFWDLLISQQTLKFKIKIFLGKLLNNFIFLLNVVNKNIFGVIYEPICSSLKIRKFILVTLTIWTHQNFFSMKFEAHLMFLNSWWSVYLFLIIRLLNFQRLGKVNLLISIDILFWRLTRFICGLCFRTDYIRILFPFN